MECFLATVSSPWKRDQFYDAVRKVPTAKPSSIRAVATIRLSLMAREASPDIIHLIGTNALVFAPFSKLLRSEGRIIRHIFTSYDRGDLAVRPIRWLTNTLFINSYAFTTPRIGRWAEEQSVRTRRFLIRPPVNCDLYRPLPDEGSDFKRDQKERTVLYMGPLWNSRFPASRVLKAMKLLVEKGINTRLLVLTSAIRTSVMDSERLIALGKTLGLDHRLTLRRVDLSEDERVAAYNGADVVIFPYVGPVPEKLADPPFGILEAMGCGRVVLSTDVLSVSEVVNDGETGFVARDSTPEVIAAGLYRALTASNRKRIERNARQRILTDFSYPRVGEFLMNSYSSMLE